VDKSEGKKGYWVVKLDNSGTNLSQRIYFAPVLNKNIGDSPFQLSATASSKLPVVFQVLSAP